MPAAGTEALPAEAAGLFASEDFVAERNRIAKELRAAGRREDAEAVAKLRKPPKIVAVTNRAARALPLQAQAATAAAEKLAGAQAAGDRRAAEEALTRLGRAVEQLAERAAENEDGDRVAIAQLIRAALTSAAARRQLVEGQLAETPEPSGFEALSGMTITSQRSSAPAAGEPPAATKARERADARREKLEQELSEAREQLSMAEDELRDAQRLEAAARRARESAERRVETSRTRVDRLRRRSS